MLFRHRFHKGSRPQHSRIRAGRSSAFTFLELLLVVAIMVLAYVGVTQLFHRAYAIWRNDARLSLMLTRARGTLDILSGELRNAPIVEMNNGNPGSSIDFGIPDTVEDDSGTNFSAIGWTDTSEEGAYQQTCKLGTGATSKATWNFNILVPGNYTVYEWHPAVSTNAASVTYSTTGTCVGTCSTLINETANGGTWKALGTFTFAQGNQSVSLQAGNGVVADAVKLSWASSNPSTTLAYYLNGTTLEVGYDQGATRTTVADLLDNVAGATFSAYDATGALASVPNTIKKVRMTLVLSDPNNIAPNLTLTSDVIREIIVQPPVITQVHYAPKVYFYDDMDGGGMVLTNASTIPPTYLYGNFINPTVYNSSTNTAGGFSSANGSTIQPCVGVNTANCSTGDDPWVTFNDWFDNGEYGPKYSGQEVAQDTSCLGTSATTAYWQLGFLSTTTGINFYSTGAITTPPNLDTNIVGGKAYYYEPAQDYVSSSIPPERIYPWNNNVNSNYGTSPYSLYGPGVSGPYGTSEGEFLSTPLLTYRDPENSSFPANYTMEQYYGANLGTAPKRLTCTSGDQGWLALYNYKNSPSWAFVTYAVGTVTPWTRMEYFGSSITDTASIGQTRKFGFSLETLTTTSGYDGVFIRDRAYMPYVNAQKVGGTYQLVNSTNTPGETYFELGNPNGDLNKTLSTGLDDLNPQIIAQSPFGSKVWMPQVKTLLIPEPMESRLVTPAMDLSKATSPILRFFLYTLFPTAPATGKADYGLDVEAGVPKVTSCSVGAFDWNNYCWTVLSPSPAYDSTVNPSYPNPLDGMSAYGCSTGWRSGTNCPAGFSVAPDGFQMVTVSLSGFAGKAGVKIRFRLGQNDYFGFQTGGSFDGPALDNVEVYESGQEPHSLRYIQIYNPNSFNYDVGNYKIQTTRGTYTIVADGVGGTSIPAGGFGIVTAGGTNTCVYGGIGCSPPWTAPTGATKLMLDYAGTTTAVNAVPLDVLWDKVTLLDNTGKPVDQLSYNVVNAWDAQTNGWSGWPGTQPGGTALGIWQKKTLDQSNNPTYPFYGSIEAGLTNNVTKSAVWTTGGYTPGNNGLLPSPSISLSNLQNPILSYWTWYNMNRLLDGMEVREYNGTSWGPLDPCNFQKQYDAPVYPFDQSWGASGSLCVGFGGVWGNTDFSSASGSSTSPTYWNRQYFNLPLSDTQFALDFGSSTSPYPTGSLNDTDIVFYGLTPNIASSDCSSPPCAGYGYPVGVWIDQVTISDNWGWVSGSNPGSKGTGDSLWRKIIPSDGTLYTTWCAAAANPGAWSSNSTCPSGL